ncbi:hypothetical protein [Aquabacterium sp.]|uniref:hypothetical protein n=1 Tax=Aquabacterium sp. TaxID=1872578 RepID=UPI0024877FD5|nr:hypothetical protein [Aquabacterium sp.]MDI1260549.1 hypothetical protein [Aquabacterium sp.]
MKKAIRITGLVVLVAGITASSTAYFLEGRRMVKALVLEFPLLLEGSSAPGQTYLLPKGTTLYYEQAFPEGFVRYRMYVNVEGVKLEPRDIADPTAISPVTAYPAGKAELRKLLSEYPLSKDDLQAILKSSVMTKEEIRSLLDEYSR